MAHDDSGGTAKTWTPPPPPTPPSEPKESDYLPSGPGAAGTLSEYQKRKLRARALEDYEKRMEEYRERRKAYDEWLERKLARDRLASLAAALPRKAEEDRKSTGDGPVVITAVARRNGDLDVHIGGWAVNQWIADQGGELHPRDCRLDARGPSGEKLRPNDTRKLT